MENEKRDKLKRIIDDDLDATAIVIVAYYESHLDIWVISAHRYETINREAGWCEWNMKMLYGRMIDRKNTVAFVLIDDIKLIINETINRFRFWNDFAIFVK